jgi:oligopeptidase B
MKSYSPYDNVKPQAYPNMYISTGLHDSQVQYWEPAKWVAKLRTLKTNNTLLFLDTNMDAGHGGASGRFEAIKELAKEFSFLLDLEKIKSNSKNHFKFGDDCRIINFSSIGYFFIKKK